MDPKYLSVESSGCLEWQPKGHGKNSDLDEDKNHKKTMEQSDLLP